MRVLLSTIGSRGDVQPLVALASQLASLGQEVHLCAPPDFGNWIGSLGFSFTPLGQEVRKLTATRPIAPISRSPDDVRRMMHATVATQFETLTAAAQGCAVIVAATAVQVAAASVAEMMGIRYVFVAYCPTVLPSPHHAPNPLTMLGDTPGSVENDNRELWARDAKRFNDTFGAALNSYRASLGLDAVSDVRRYMFTDRPWLAADSTLAPWPDPADQSVFQSGAWILPDDGPLSPDLEAFLEDGEPPVYFGFGSTRAPRGLGRVMIQTARALGRRAIVSRGWADVSADNEPDCLSIGEASLHALFRRVAAVVHHGGAGTTTEAAFAGVPQVVIPQIYDQHYWAQRVHALGIGTAHPSGTPTVDSLTRALKQTLESDAAARARSIAKPMRADGARIAAQRLIDAEVRDIHAEYPRQQPFPVKDVVRSAPNRSTT